MQHQEKRWRDWWIVVLFAALCFDVGCAAEADVEGLEELNIGEVGQAQHTPPNNGQRWPDNYDIRFRTFGGAAGDGLDTWVIGAYQQMNFHQTGLEPKLLIRPALSTSVADVYVTTDTRPVIGSGNTWPFVEYFHIECVDISGSPFTKRAYCGLRINTFALLLAAGQKGISEGELKAAAWCRAAWFSASYQPAYGSPSPGFSSCGDNISPSGGAAANTNIYALNNQWNSAALSIPLDDFQNIRAFMNTQDATFNPDPFYGASEL